MARIRTVKPEFFRHEVLQDLEIKNPGKYPMMVFEGLWVLCDKTGRFEWRPRQIKLDILPFLPFDMEETLCILEKEGILEKYEVDGKYYGFIPSFKKHQVISGKELQAPARYPEAHENKTGSVREVSGKCPGSERDEPESQEKEKEKEKEKNTMPDKSGYSQDFETFWKAYPKKSGSKKAAFENWKKLNGNKPDIETILSAIAAQTIWRKNANGEFRPEWKDPERWIKNRMWEAETAIGQSREPPSMLIECSECKKRVMKSDLENGKCFECNYGKPKEIQSV
jgi:hypothetical protein